MQPIEHHHLLLNFKQRELIYFGTSGAPTPAPETVEDQEGCEGEGEEEEVLEEDMCVDEA